MEIEKTDVIEEGAEQAVTASVEESSDTTNPQQSPEEVQSVAGEQTAETEQTEGTESQPSKAVDTEAEVKAESGESKPEDGQTDRKNRTAKRFDSLLDQNRQLKEQLRAALTGGQQTAPSLTPQAPTLQGINTVPQQQDTPEYWAGLYHQETDDSKRSQIAQRYEQSRERQLEDRMLNRIRQEEQAKQQVSLVIDELTDLNEVSPIFKPGTAEIDMDSVLMKAASAKAAQRGQRITGVQELLFWGNKAARDIVRLNGIEAQVEAKKTATKLNQTIAKTGLEGTNRSAAPKGPQDRASVMKSLRAKAQSGDIGAAQELTRLQISSHMAA